jgi:hypothetical protein
MTNYIALRGNNSDAILENVQFDEDHLRQSIKSTVVNYKNVLCKLLHGLNFEL